MNKNCTIRDLNLKIIEAQVRIIYSQVKELAGNENSQGATN